MAGLPTTFHKNDGTGTYISSSLLVFPTVESLGWSRDGYTFVSWNTRADGTGESFAGGSDNPGPTETGYGVYYAIWEVDVPTYLDMNGLAHYDSLVKVIINGKVDAGGKAGGIPYGSVDSTSTSTIFTATVDGLTELYDGACMMLHNGVVTSAKNFTVNINGLGAKKCYSNMTNATQETTVFNANYTLMFVYSTALDDGNGGWWIYRGYDANTTYTPAKLGFGYGHCTTAAATAAKAVAISGYTLVTGGIVSVRFDNDVQAGATLNVTSKGAKAIYHKGAAITDGVIKAGDTATFIYSGQYHLIGIDHDACTLPTATVTQLADGATITITDEQGTTTATVHDGADGFSPTVSVQTITGGHEVTITDAQGAHSFDVMDGEGGTDSTTQAHVAQLWGNQLTKELTGEILAAADTYAAPPMALTVDGKSTQVTTTGKNLLPPSNQYYTRRSVNGTVMRTVAIPLSQGESVTWHRNNKGGISIIAWWCDALGDTVTATQIKDLLGYNNYVITNSDGHAYVLFTINTGYNLSVIVPRQGQIEMGTSFTGYEPYSGGFSSPSPEWAQPITSPVLSGVSIGKRNILDANFEQTFTKSSLTVRNDGTGIFTLTTDATRGARARVFGKTKEVFGDGPYPGSYQLNEATAIRLPAGTYRIVSSGNRDGVEAGIVANELGDGSGLIGNGATVTSDGNLYYYGCFAIGNLGNIPSSGAKAWVMVMPIGSSVPAEYEPYTDTTIPVLSEGTTMRSLPDGTKDTLSLTYLRPSTREGWAWYSRKLTVLVGETTTAATDGITGTVGVDVMSTTGEIADGPTVLYKLSTPSTTTLDPIELPVLPAPDVTVWCDPSTGLQMRYVRDTNLAFAQLEAALAEIATS